MSTIDKFCFTAAILGTMVVLCSAILLPIEITGYILCAFLIIFASVMIYRLWSEN